MCYGIDGDVMKELLTVMLCVSLVSARTQQLTNSHPQAYRQALSQVISSLHLKKKDPLTQISTIYRYILTHVDYDYETYFHVAHRTTAYHALCEKKANCQGISLLLKDMCHCMHIKAPLVKGTYRGEPHVWNVIKLGRYYYNADATLDDHKLSCFLVSDADLVDHKRTTKVSHMAPATLGMQKINYPLFKYYQYKAPKEVTIRYAYDGASLKMKATQTLYRSNIKTPMYLKDYQLHIAFRHRGDYAITLKNKQSGKFLNYYFYIH